MRNGLLDPDGDDATPKRRRWDLDMSANVHDVSAFPDLESAAMLPSPHTQGRDVRPLRAMVVDDEEINGALVTSMLEEAGFEVRQAASAEDFLCLLAGGMGRVDVLISDVNMPGMNGFELLEHIRDTDETLAVVMMTAADGYENVRRALSLGAYGYLGKPFGDSDDVLQLVRSAATATRMARENARLMEALLARTEELRILALTDPLTGLFNRRHIDRLLDAHVSLSRENDLALSLIMLDIDRFKLFNDDHGHDVGDQVLCHVARRIESAIREEDSFGRFGGEEFIIVLPDTDPQEAQRLALRLRELIAMSPVIHEDKALSVTASFGVAGRGQGAPVLTARELMLEADRGVYRAKETGRNRVVCSASLADAA